MKKVIVLFWSTLLSLSISAQSIVREFGAISMSELTMETYEEDPEANALVIYDIGKSFFFLTDNGFKIRFTRTKRIKILKTSGLDQADIEIYLYQDGYGRTEILTDIKATTTLLENGFKTVQTLDKKNVYTEKVTSKHIVKKFTFPGAVKGAVLEYSYTIETPFLFNLPEWRFQDKIPTRYSQYTVYLVPFYEYAFLAQGISKFDLRETEVLRNFEYLNSVKYRTTKHVMALKNIEAFKDEAYITSINDYIKKVNFQLSKVYRTSGSSEEIVSTWPKLIDELQKNEHFGLFIKKSIKSAKGLNGVIPLPDNETEKVKTLVNYVKANYSWNHVSSKYASDPVKKFLDSKKGSSGSMNLYLLALLRYHGIEADPVILSTRDHGKISSDYPFSSFFNYVLVRVKADGETFLVDGTNSAIAFNRVPPRCINEKGLLIKDGDEVTWVNLSSPVISVDNKTIKIAIDPETFKAAITLKIEATEFDGYNYRYRFKDDADQVKKKMQEKGINNISNIHFSNYNYPDSTYVVSMTGSSSIEHIGNNIILKPFLNIPMQKSLLTQPERSYPVDLIYVSKEVYVTTIIIPENYKVASLPESKTFNNDLARIGISYSVNGNTITVSAIYYLKKPVYNKYEYPRIKYYMSWMVKKFNEEIVLSREES